MAHPTSDATPVPNGWGVVFAIQAPPAPTTTFLTAFVSTTPVGARSWPSEAIFASPCRVRAPHSREEEQRKEHHRDSVGWIPQEENCALHQGYLDKEIADPQQPKIGDPQHGDSAIRLWPCQRRRRVVPAVEEIPEGSHPTGPAPAAPPPVQIRLCPLSPWTLVRPHHHSRQTDQRSRSNNREDEQSQHDEVSRTAKGLSSLAQFSNDLPHLRPLEEMTEEGMVVGRWAHVERIGSVPGIPMGAVGRIKQIYERFVVHRRRQHVVPIDLVVPDIGRVDEVKRSLRRKLTDGCQLCTGERRPLDKKRDHRITTERHNLRRGVAAHSLDRRQSEAQRP